MNTILQSIKASIAALTANIKAASEKIYEEANIRKEKLAAAIQDMREVHSYMKQFAAIGDNFADIVATCTEMDAAGEFVNDMLSDMDVFESNVEKFNGYCDGCGCELTTDDETHLTATDEFICNNCWVEYTSTPTQIEIPIETKSE